MYNRDTTHIQIFEIHRDTISCSPPTWLPDSRQVCGRRFYIILNLSINLRLYTEEETLRRIKKECRLKGKSRSDWTSGEMERSSRWSSWWGVNDTQADLFKLEGVQAANSTPVRAGHCLRKWTPMSGRRESCCSQLGRESVGLYVERERVFSAVSLLAGVQEVMSLKPAETPQHRFYWTVSDCSGADHFPSTQTLSLQYCKTTYCREKIPLS